MRQPLPTSPAQDPAGVTYELAVHTLIAAEQIIRLLESILRHRPGAAEELLEEAGLAAQRRLGRRISVPR